MSEANRSVAGIILCGGQSSRMGRPKAWLPFAGEIMLPRVARILSAVVEPIVVVGAPEQELPPLPADVIVTRDETPGQGPLQGLAAGLAALEGRTSAAYVSSCDAPLLQPAFVRRMIVALGEDAIAVPFVEGRHQPLAAVYRLDVLASVRRLLEQGRRRPLFLFEENATRLVTEDALRGVDPELLSLRNTNTPEEYAEAVRLAESRRTTS